MAYDAAKDQVLETWENEETGLIISINRYGEGDPKLQIGPRAYTKRDGSKGTIRAGRLTIDDLLWLSEILEEVKARMNDHFMDG
jgi:hypothetical protein